MNALGSPRLDFSQPALLPPRSRNVRRDAAFFQRIRQVLVNQADSFEKGEMARRASACRSAQGELLRSNFGVVRIDTRCRPAVQLGARIDSKPDPDWVKLASN
jgi:hypothetical protein